jgi:hypothetical protein
MTEQKRYRVQLQFDVYADNDKDAAELIGDTIYNIKDFHNSDVIYLAEAPFANMNHREINYDTLAEEISGDRYRALINDPLPF